MIRSAVNIKFHPLILLIVFGAGLFFIFAAFISSSNGQIQVEESEKLPPYCLGSWEDAGQADVGFFQGTVGLGEFLDAKNKNKFHVILSDGAGAHSYHGINEPAANDYALEYVKRIGEFNFHNYTRAMVVSPGERGTIYCPPLDSMVKFKANSDKVAEGGKFTISWEAPFALSCVLSGKAPENLLSSPESFDGKNSYIKGSRSYDFVQRGIYTFKFDCLGYIDNAKSPIQGHAIRDVKVYVGEIPDLPAVNLTIEPSSIKRGQSATLTWTSQNAFTVYITQNIGQNIGVVSKNGSIKVSPADTTIYTITANPEFPELGLVKQFKTIYVTAPLAPSVSLKAEPDSIKRGESATLSWTSENATALSIDNGIGVVRTQGSISVKPNVTTQYKITARGELNKADSDMAVVRVDGVEIGAGGQGPAIIEGPGAEVDLPKAQEADKIDLKINGQDNSLTMSAPANINLSWNLDRYCLAYGSWVGVKSKSGAENRALTKSGTYTYRLYCPTAGSDAVSVKVISGGGAGAISLPVAEASISLDGKSFSKSIRVTRGKTVNIRLSAGADINGDKKVSRDSTGGWSSLMSNGGRCDWNYDLNQGTPTFDTTVSNSNSASDCDIDLGQVTFYDKPGVYTYGALRLVQSDGKVSGVSNINIAVEDPPPPNGPPVIDLSINGQKDRAFLGAPAEYSVNWSVKNADTCSASGDWSGDRFFGGSQKFVSSFKRDFIYTLTCVGKLGTANKSIFLKVAELPVCDFSALPAVLSKSSVFERQSVLSWKCQFANFCEISPGTGASTGTFGSARVSPLATTEYTLTCRNLDGKSSFSQTVEVK